MELVAGTPTTRGPGFEPREHFGPGETVVVAVTLQDCPPGTRCEAVRYCNGQYQDFQSVRIQKQAPGTEYFRWPGPRAGGQRPGAYRVKVFLNGRFARQIDYTVG